MQKAFKYTGIHAPGEANTKGMQAKKETLTLC